MAVSGTWGCVLKSLFSPASPPTRQKGNRKRSSHVDKEELGFSYVD